MSGVASSEACSVTSLSASIYELSNTESCAATEDPVVSAPMPQQAKDKLRKRSKSKPQRDSPAASDDKSGEEDTTGWKNVQPVTRTEVLDGKGIITVVSGAIQMHS